MSTRDIQELEIMISSAKKEKQKNTKNQKNRTKNNSLQWKSNLSKSKMATLLEVNEPCT